MNDEDKQKALDLYSTVFDEVSSENEILQLLGSPTRQAVNLARAYNANERKQQMAAGYLAEEPEFVQVIEEIRKKADELGLSVTHVDANQMSMFEGPDAAAEFLEQTEQPDAEQTTADVDLPELPVNESLFPDEDLHSDLQPPAPEIPMAAAQQPVAETWTQAPAYSADANDKEVEAFLKDFHIPDDQAAAGNTKNAHNRQSGSDMKTPTDDLYAPRAKAPAERPAAKDVPDVSMYLKGQKARTKPRIMLLILFILIAVPVTLACICLLLIPTLLSLSLSGAGIICGVWGLMAAFTSFFVFADILVVFGLSLVILALGLLFLWIFFWLLFGVIPDLIRGVCGLARRWCYKEVAA